MSRVHPDLISQCGEPLQALVLLLGIFPQADEFFLILRPKEYHQ